MQDFFNFFNQGWVGSLIGLIGILLGAVGIFSYRISKSIAKPSYQKSSLRLIGREENNLPQEVVVTYKGMVVDRLTKTTLILWNNGTEVLDGKDVVQTDPLVIAFLEGDSILSYKILKQANSANKILVEKDSEKPNQLGIVFDYLNPNDGWILEILHDSESRYPEVIGSIKGLPKGFLDLGRVYKNRKVKYKWPLGLVLNRPRLILGVALVIGLTIALFGLLPEDLRQIVAKFLSNEESNKTIAEQPIFFVILGVLYAAMPAFVLWTRRKRYPRKLEIEELDS
ncbi:hypothetical protein [Vreelandella titanicae]|uniref:hypothetical protein n=1 Tax=Vreelandella titanicae TaxID=664683 RepID=UPI001144E1B6|nr:hypothetical protein [Halomonas titanicae]